MQGGVDTRVAYEVNLHVEEAIAIEFRTWLDTHVRQILGVGGFLGATLLEVRDPAPSPGHIALCMQYMVRDPAALDAYLRDHAPRMRAEGTARFGGRFTARRRVMDVVAEFGR
jgi:hypothetical protein